MGRIRTEDTAFSSYHREEAEDTSENTKRTLSLTGLFAAFMFLQLTVLGLGNHAGEGYLELRLREIVYYVLQVFAILGFLSRALVRELSATEQDAKGVLLGILGLFLAGVTVMLFGKSPVLTLAATCAAVFCLGCLGSAVYERMSREATGGARVALSMGLGCAGAVALQFPLQFQWGVTPLLPVFMLAAFLLLAALLLRGREKEAFAAPPQERTPPRRLLFACLIAGALLLFTSFYNGYIQHQQIQSGYTEYNVYTWPRLMLVPCYLLFAAIGDWRQGKLVPAAALCISLAALLNSVLTEHAGAKGLNMCLFYCAVAAMVSYYNLTFWRLAQGTKRPALWASMGRVLDSVSVLILGMLRLSSLPAPIVLALDIGGLAAVIVLLALSGGFSFSVPAQAQPVPVLSGEGDEETEEIPVSEQDPFAELRSRYGLTPREAEVLRELVLTEDTQTAIGDRLGINVKTLQGYVTRLYRKTGAKTRSGLTDLYHGIQNGR